MRVKQLVASVTASFDDFVKKVENHEAVAEHVLADVRSAAARLQVQARRIQADIERRTATRNEALAAQQRWHGRAVACGAEDESQALDCMDRAEESGRQASIAEKQLARCEGLLVEVEATKADVEARLADLTHRNTVLSSRTARADVLSCAQQSHGADEADSVFERWECAVIEKEYREPVLSSARVDPLERAYEQAERAERLKSQLEALRKGSSSGSASEGAS